MISNIESAPMIDSPQSRPVKLIADLPAGAAALVHSLTGGRDFCSRMANLGFTAGASVMVRQNYGRGPIVVAVRGTLVALGRAEASRIFVRASEA
jgi:Fe2+ transport system protein FeoA